MSLTRAAKLDERLPGREEGLARGGGNNCTGAGSAHRDRAAETYKNIDYNINKYI